MAVLVVIFHTDVAFRHTTLNPVGTGAVYGFFVLSGYVLARFYKGPTHLFFVRRLIRLWPLYAATLVVAYAVEGRLPPLPEFVWIHSLPIAVYENGSVWSLYIEAWMTPALPILVWLARKNRACILLLALAAFPLGVYDEQLFCVMFLLLGIAASQFKIELPRYAPAPAIWLGKVSYSLYLTHAIVMRVAFHFGGKWAVLASLPVVFAVAWATWRLIELPCTQWGEALMRPSTTSPAAAVTTSDREFRDAHQSGTAYFAEASPASVSTRL
jgi:peptidoglycan/LPS O-acetylase OafA/YrhL